MALATSENILKLFFSYNPWWQTGTVQKQFNKPIKRFPFYESLKVLNQKQIRRLVILCGARRTGKTTIMYQIVAHLLEKGVNPKNILFLSFDHPLLKLCSIDDILEIYKANISSSESCYFFFDEIQYAENWNQWLKIIYDTNPQVNVVATGSASPILTDKVSESGLGRWKILHVPTLSFYEYCQLLNVTVPELPNNVTLDDLHLKPLQEQTEIFNKLSCLQLHFIRYLQVGGFPELALSPDDVYAQRVLREDIVDKALKRDLPAIYGIRNLTDIEKVFLYLCYTSSNIINVAAISKEFEGVSRNTIEKYITYLESANLIYISQPIHMNGKQILKAQNKIYIADAAMRNAVLMKDDITTDPVELGIIAETTIYKHIKAFYYNEAAQIGYYRGDKKDKEIDIVVKSNNAHPILIEVKYRDQAKITEKDEIVAQANNLYPNFVVTKRANDFGECLYGDKKIYRIPAPAFLYLLGKEEMLKNVKNLA